MNSKREGKYGKYIKEMFKVNLISKTFCKSICNIKK